MKMSTNFVLQRENIYLKCFKLLNEQEREVMK